MNTSPERLDVRLFLNIHGQSWECADGDIIGREGTLAREIFQGAAVLSRRHIEIRVLNGEWVVSLCPTARNMTWINEEEMLPSQMYALGPQSVITVEEIQFTLLAQPADDYLGEGTVAGWALPEHRTPDHSFANGDHNEAIEEPDSGVANLLERLPGCVMVFDDLERRVWNNEEATTLLGQDEPPSTIAALCLSFHREDEILLKRSLSLLEEGIATIESGLRVVDSATGETTGTLTLSLLRIGGQTIVSGEADPGPEQSLIGLRLLSETYLSSDFQDADLRVCLQAIAENGLNVLRCDNVSIWLMDDEGSKARLSVAVARDAESSDTSKEIQPGFCPFYFDRLTADPYAAFETQDSPAMPILRDLGFAGGETAAILAVPLLQGGLKGIVAFEWDRWSGGKLGEDTRLSGLMVASLCLSAAASTSHQSALKQLRLREEQMKKELADAEHYVRQILPPPLSGEIDVSWKLKPSAQLGGDAFGYHWIDDERFAIYLLDVVGHGTGAALLSISAMNSVRAQILPHTDFGNPAAVLAGLNCAFQMETQNDMTFTVWYGIYHRSTRQLVYASAGHPPALLIDPSRANQCVELSTDGLIIGHMDDFEYENAAAIVPPGAKLYVLSDGAFEIERPDGAMWPYEQFVAAVRSTGSMEEGEVDYLYQRTQQVLEGAELQDDFTMLRVRFPI